MSWYISVLKQYAVFSGRARRTEYWMFVPCNVVFMLLVGMVDRLIGSDKGILSSIYSLAVLIPSLAIGGTPSARHRQQGLVAADRPYPRDRYPGAYLLYGLQRPAGAEPLRR